MSAALTLGAMTRDAQRTLFGERLRAARLGAQMSQEALAKAVGMSQGALAEAERTGDASKYTAQLARECRVDPYWLATGVGLPDAPAAPAAPPPTAREAMAILAAALASAPEESRVRAGTLLGKLT